MLRLELLNVKADLERELADLVLDCSDCGHTLHWVAGGDRLVDELVGLRRLLGDAPDCPLEDAAFASDHGGMVGRPKGCRGKGASK